VDGVYASGEGGVSACRHLQIASSLYRKPRSDWGSRWGVVNRLVRETTIPGVPETSWAQHHFIGASNEENPAYQLQSFPAPVEDVRVLFPRSRMNITLEPFLDVTSLRREADDLVLDVQHRLNPPDATLFYRLKPDLTIGQRRHRQQLRAHTPRTTSDRHPPTKAC
jgi:hypothetical protein